VQFSFLDIREIKIYSYDNRMHIVFGIHSSATLHPATVLQARDANYIMNAHLLLQQQDERFPASKNSAVAY